MGAEDEVDGGFWAVDYILNLWWREYHLKGLGALGKTPFYLISYVG